MNTLYDLKKHFEKSNIRVKKYTGYSLTTKHGSFGMFAGEYFLNYKQISRDDIRKLA